MNSVLMQTEAVHDDASGMDSWRDEKIFDFIIAGQMRAIAAVSQARSALIEAANAIAARLKAGGTLFYAGAGSSIRIGALDGSELHSTFGWPESRLKFLIAGGRDALTHTVDAAEDDVLAGTAAGAKCSAADALIAIAASGQTPYTLAAARQAKQTGCLVVTLANNGEAPLLTCGDFGILLPSGPEAIVGSTRLAAGTAQKAALNLLSSMVFTKLGAVHDGLMVNVIAGNIKLRKRARHIVMTIAGCDENTAAAALEAAGGSIKLAVLTCCGVEDTDAARRLLLESGDSLRMALSRIHQSV